MNHASLQTATPNDELPSAQQKALAALLAGQTVTAELDRTTFYRRLHDLYKPGFRATLERGRREMRQAMEAQLLPMTSKAADCLEGAWSRETGRPRWHCSRDWASSAVHNGRQIHAPRPGRSRIRIAFLAGDFDLTKRLSAPDIPGGELVQHNALVHSIPLTLFESIYG